MSELHPQLSHHTKEAENNERAFFRGDLSGNRGTIAKVTDLNTANGSQRSTGEAGSADTVENRV